MGGWVGGQAEYVLVPYADWNLLKFPDKDQAMEKILDLAMLSDIFPTGLPRLRHRRASQPGSTVYIAGAGPVGLAARALGVPARRRRRDRRRPQQGPARAGAQLRLRDRRRVGRATRKDQIEQILGVPEVDCARRRRRLRGARPRRARRSTERPATVLNTLMDVTRAGGALGIPGLYVTGDPGAADEAAKHGSLSIRHRPRLGQVALPSPPASAR